MNEPRPDSRFAGTPVPTPPIPDDNGAPSFELMARLEEFATGSVDAEQVLGEVSRSRLFVPVVAVLDEAEVGPDGLRQEKHSTMATVLVQSPEGGRALLGFSGIESLTRWRGDARPVPLVAPLAARAAVDEGAETLLIDVAGPVPFALTGAELLLVAAVSRSPGEPCDDPVLKAALRHLISAEGRVTWATLLPAPEASAAGTSIGGAAVLTLGIEGADRSWVGRLVQQIASDRVVARLVPEGLRVKGVPASDVPDKPGALLGCEASL